MLGAEFGETRETERDKLAFFLVGTQWFRFVVFGWALENSAHNTTWAVQPSVLRYRGEDLLLALGFRFNC